MEFAEGKNFHNDGAKSNLFLESFLNGLKCYIDQEVLYWISYRINCPSR
jgi:hypothetical protein